MKIDFHLEYDNEYRKRYSAIIHVNDCQHKITLTYLKKDDVWTYFIDKYFNEENNWFTAVIYHDYSLTRCSALRSLRYYIGGML